MLFTGTYWHTIDEKKRVSVPSDIRADLARDANITEGSGQALCVYATVEDDMTLCLYDLKRFVEISQELRQAARTPQEVDELLAYERMKYAVSRKVEVDKAGRVRLPDDLIDLCQLKESVALVGAGDHLEVHDAERWRDRLAAAKQKPELFRNPRRFIQGRPSAS